MVIILVSLMIFLSPISSLTLGISLSPNPNLGPPQFHTPSIQHISSKQKSHSFSAPEIPQFHTKNSSVPHQKLLGSTPKTPKFHTVLTSTPNTPQFHTKTPQFHTKYPSIQHQKTLSSTPKTPKFNTTTGCVELSGFGVELSGFRCETEEYIELKGFWCGTEGKVEVRGFWCGTEGFWC